MHTTLSSTTPPSLPPHHPLASDLSYRSVSSCNPLVATTLHNLILLLSFGGASEYHYLIPTDPASVSVNTCVSVHQVEYHSSTFLSFSTNQLTRNRNLQGVNNNLKYEKSARSYAPLDTHYIFINNFLLMNFSYLRMYNCLKRILIGD